MKHSQPIPSVVNHWPPLEGIKTARILLKISSANCESFSGSVAGRAILFILTSSINSFMWNYIQKPTEALHTRVRFPPVLLEFKQMQQTPMKWWPRKWLCPSFSSPAKPGQFKEQQKYPGAQVAAVSPFTSPAVQVTLPGSWRHCSTHCSHPTCCLPPPEPRVCYLLGPFPAGKTLGIAAFHEINPQDAGCGGWSW